MYPGQITHINNNNNNNADWAHWGMQNLRDAPDFSGVSKSLDLQIYSWIGKTIREHQRTGHNLMFITDSEKIALSTYETT